MLIMISLIPADYGLAETRKVACSVLRLAAPRRQPAAPRRYHSIEPI